MKVSRSLIEMGVGQEGVVSEILGGFVLAQRLDALGIRPGAKVEKMSGPHLHGPVTVRVGNARVALGFGMAGKVFLETGEDGE